MFTASGRTTVAVKPDCRVDSITYLNIEQPGQCTQPAVLPAVTLEAGRWFIHGPMEARTSPGFALVNDGGADSDASSIGAVQHSRRRGRHNSRTACSRSHNHTAHRRRKLRPPVLRLQCRSRCLGPSRVPSHELPREPMLLPELPELQL